MLKKEMLISTPKNPKPLESKLMKSWKKNNSTMILKRMKKTMTKKNSSLRKTSTLCLRSQALLTMMLFKNTALYYTTKTLSKIKDLYLRWLATSKE